MSFMNVMRRREFMAALVFISMISFIVIGSANFGSNDRRQSGDKEVVAKTSNGDFTTQQLSQIRMGRVMLNYFRQGVASHDQPPRAVGKYPEEDELDLVNSALVAEEGRRMGISIPDSQVDAYVRGLSGDRVKTEQIRDVVRSIRINDRGVSYAQICEAIRREMLVNETLQRIAPYGDYDMAATPEQRWEYFCRLERTMKLQAHAVPVADFLTNDKIPNDPGESTLEAFYAAHKTTIPSRSSPEIGFKRPERVKLEYLKADWVKFYDLAKSKLTEQEISAEFDARKTQLRESLEMMEDMVPPPEEAAADKAKDDKAKDDKSKEDKTKADPPKDHATDKPAADAKPGENKADDKKADEKPAAAQGDASKTADAKPADTTTADSKPAADKKPAVIKAPEPDPTPYEEAIGLFATKAPKATEPRFTDEEVLARNREGIVKALAERAARVQMSKSLEIAHQRMIAFYEQSYRPWLAANKNKTADEQTPAPKFSIAQFATPESGLTYHKTDDLSAEDLTDDKSYGSTFVNRKWEKQVNTRTGLEEDQITSMGALLVEYVFANKNAMSPFRAEDSVRGSGGASYRNQYAMWVTEYKSEEVPEFADIRDEVKKAWKMANTTGVSARDLALKRAQTIADDVNGGGKTLKEQFPSANDVVETEEFTWFDAHQGSTDTNAGSMHFAEPTFHRLDELDAAYFEFARAVLRLKDKQAAAIMNDAGTIVYVVQVFDSALSSEQNLRERFVREPFTRLVPDAYVQYLHVTREQGYVIVSAYDMSRRKAKWWAAFEKQHDLDWVRPPHRGRNE
jgi:hypothetical protein